MDELDVSLMRGTLDLLILKAVSWGPRHGYAVRADGGEVGAVTSGTLSPTLGDKIAMAYVTAGRAAVGATFDVVVRERPCTAEQVKLPFYRRPRPTPAA